MDYDSMADFLIGPSEGADTTGRRASRGPKAQGARPTPRRGRTPESHVGGLLHATRTEPGVCAVGGDAGGTVAQRYSSTRKDATTCTGPLAGAGPTPDRIDTSDVVRPALINLLDQLDGSAALILFSTYWSRWRRTGCRCC